MVEDGPLKYRVFLTPCFLDDLSACVDYVANELASPLAARKMYESIRKKVENLEILPKAAVSCVSMRTGKVRYKISYNRYYIYYSVDDESLAVRILGMKHQLQNSEFDERA